MKKSSLSFTGQIGRCGDREVFLGFANASELSQISFPDILDEVTGKGYQRRFHREHSLEFKRYIQKPGATTIPLTFNLRPDRKGWKLKRGTNGATLIVDITAEPVMAQVDCQHRLGYGRRDNVKFIKGDKDKSVNKAIWDRIYVTTLFSFEWKEIAKSVDAAIEIARGDTTKIFVGGIAASLMHEKFLAEPRWRGVRFIAGLLSSSPSESLQLDDFAEELYSDDFNGTPIEDLVPDYSILDQIPPY